MRNGHRTKPNIDTDRIGLLQTRNSTNSVTGARMASLPVTQGFSHLPMPRGSHQVNFPHQWSVDALPGGMHGCLHLSPCHHARTSCSSVLSLVPKDIFDILCVWVDPSFLSAQLPLASRVSGFLGFPLLLTLR